MELTCDQCGKKMKEVDDQEIKGFMIRGWRCSCGQEYSNPVDVDNLVKLFNFMKKQRGLKVFRSGNSLALRIPKQLADVYHITSESRLVVSPKKDSIEIKVLNR